MWARSARTTRRNSISTRATRSRWCAATAAQGQSAAVTNASDGGTTFGKPYDFIGTKTFGSVQGYEDYAKKFIYDVTVPGCNQPARVFVGQRKEPFAVNLGKVFDLVNLVPVDGTAFPGGIMQDPENNQIADKNITTLALEVPASCLTGSGNGVIGGWTSASLRQARILNPRPTFSKPEVSGGPWTQVSRLSNPLVNEWSSACRTRIASTRASRRTTASSPRT